MIDYEQERVALQITLDKQKTQAERNRLGQFATPTELARDIVAHSVSLLPKNVLIRFLDPAIGTGSFYSALRETIPAERIEAAVGYEIDRHYGLPAQKLWSDTAINIHLADFTSAIPPTKEAERSNLLVCNPPYVRHHHLVNGDKVRLQAIAQQVSGVKLSGLAGLYCYFLLLSHAWLAQEGIAAWLIPSEFMDVNYGRAIKDYLLNQVSLLRIHRFDPNDLQFSDALVSSAIVWFRKAKPNRDHTVEFTFGGSIHLPKISKTISTRALNSESKWTRFPIQVERKINTGVVLSDLFEIKRGMATGDNKFFILTQEQIEQHQLPKKFLRPILPSPRYLTEDEIPAKSDGSPTLEPRLYLLDCPLREEQVQAKYPTLWNYLSKGKSTVSQGYICKHRTPWYSQEDRPPAPFVCPYIGRTDTQRGRPFRFLLNHSNATASNVYLMLYPKPFLAVALANDSTLARKIWQALNEIHTQTFLAEGRVYGGGLYKMEPRELAKIPAEHLLALIPNYRASSPLHQKDFLEDVVDSPLVSDQ